MVQQTKFERILLNQAPSCRSQQGAGEHASRNALSSCVLPIKAPSGDAWCL